MINPEIKDELCVTVPIRILGSMAVAMQDACERLDCKGTNVLTEHLCYLNITHKIQINGDRFE